MNVRVELIERLHRLQEIAFYDVNIWLADQFEDKADEETLIKAIADIDKEIDRCKSS